MNRGGIPLPSIPPQGRSYTRQVAERVREFDLHAEEEQPYANLDTTELPESLQQKLRSVKTKPPVTKKTALRIPAGIQHDNLPSPPPLPSPTLSPLLHHHGSTVQPPPIPPQHPSHSVDEDSDSNLSNSAVETRRDYVEVEHLHVTTTVGERRPYPYEMSSLQEDLPQKNVPEKDSPEPADNSSLENSGERHVHVKEEGLKATAITIEAIPSIPADEFIMDLGYEHRFTEHRGVRLFPAYSAILGCVYKYSLLCIYNVLLFVMGIFLALCWGTVYAVVAFLQIWLIMPLQAIQLLCIKGCCQLLLEPMRLFCETISKSCRVKGRYS